MKQTRLSWVVLSVCVAFSLLSSQSVRIEIDGTKPTRPIHPWIYGINTASWDESLFPGATKEMLLTADRDAIAKIKASGVTLLKYPGGNAADQYVWNAPTNNASEMDTDEYIALCRETGAEPFITINFNEATELAAEWVRYCNIIRGYNVKLWEVGDEQWGWWAKGHAPPEEYARKYISFVKAMKAVDPTIKVATNVPLGPHPENWTERVLRAAGDYVDMITFTYFPQQGGRENDDSLLATTAQYRILYRQLLSEVERVVGPEKARNLLYVNVGYNSVNTRPGPQTVELVNALWVADMLGSMAELGTDIACFWALHNEYPPRGGDFGYLSSDGKNTPRYTYYVFPMFVKHFGGQVLPVLRGDSTVSAYASRRGKSLSVALINKSTHQSKRVELLFRGFTAGPHAEAWILDRKRKNEKFSPLHVRAERVEVRLPPFSLLMLRFVDRDSSLRHPNVALSAVATASSHSPENALWGPGHFDAAKAIDGNRSTRWRSGIRMKEEEQDLHWLRLMWQRRQQIGFVRILWGENYATDYELQISDDGQMWKPLRVVSGGKGGVEEHILESPVSARFFRFFGKKGAKGGSAYAIREIEVYEKKESREE